MLTKNSGQDGWSDAEFDPDYDTRTNHKTLFKTKSNDPDVTIKKVVLNGDFSHNLILNDLNSNDSKLRGNSPYGNYLESKKYDRKMQSDCEIVNEIKSLLNKLDKCNSKETLNIKKSRSNAAFINTKNRNFINNFESVFKNKYRIPLQEDEKSSEEEIKKLLDKQNLFYHNDEYVETSPLRNRLRRIAAKDNSNYKEITSGSKSVNKILDTLTSNKSNIIKTQTKNTEELLDMMSNSQIKRKVIENSKNPKSHHQRMIMLSPPGYKNSDALIVANSYISLDPEVELQNAYKYVRVKDVLNLPKLIVPRFKFK